MRRHRAVASLLTVTALGAFAGCGGSGSDESDATTATTVRDSIPDACDVLPTRDATEFLDAPVEQRTQGPGATRSEGCAYSSTRPAQLLQISLTNDVQVLRGIGFGDAVAVQNIGEEAYLRSGAPRGSVTLDFRARGLVVSLAYSDLQLPGTAGGDVPTSRDTALIALAEQIVTRL
jgi:hypothetical protein